LTKIIKNDKIDVQKIQGRHVLRKKKQTVGTLHNVAKGLVPLFVAICRFSIGLLPLFAANDN
jgi:hypothetical protein